MPDELRRAGEVASMLGVHVNTVRNWTDEFVGYMEAGVNVPKKETRLYSDRDINLLKLVASERGRKRSIADIKAMIDAMVPADRTAVAIDAPQPLAATETRPEGQEHAIALVQDLAAQIQPLLSDAFERGRQLGIEQGRRKVAPELIVAALCIVLLLVALGALWLTR